MQEAGTLEADVDEGLHARSTRITRPR